MEKLVSGWSNLFEPTQADATEASAPSLLKEYKQQAIDQAKRTAGTQGREPTMSDYYMAAEVLGETYQTQMAQQGISWGPAIYADVHDLRFDGFLIRKHEIEPTPDIQDYAQKLAYSQAKAQGRDLETSPLTRLEMMDAVRQTNDLLGQGPLPTQPQAMENLLDLDGDHKIGALYSEIANQTNFEGTVFSNVTFHPAGTLTKFHAEGASFENVTFDGMTDKVDARGEVDHVRLSSGNYENIRFTNITGGRIELADHARINKMDISGQTAQLVVGSSAVLTNLKATDTNIVTFLAKPGSQISDSILKNTTIGMNSELKGCNLKNITFDNTNLSHVDMQGAKLTKIAINGSVRNLDLGGADIKQLSINVTDKKDLQGLNLTGASIKNMKINGEAIESPAQLTALGIKSDSRTAIQADDDFVRVAKNEQAIAKALEIGQKMASSLQTSSPSDIAQQAPSQRTQEQQAAKSAGPSMDYYRQMSDRGGRA